MTNLQVVAAYDKITPSPKAADDIWQRAVTSAKEPEKLQPHTPTHVKKNSKTIRRTLLIAAVIASLMTVTAVAENFYGVKNVTKNKDEQLVSTVQPDGSIESTTTPVIELGSTRPYDGPDWAMEWIDTAQKAFDEYWAYKEANPTFDANDLDAWINEKADSGYNGFLPQDNGDGTYTFIPFYIGSTEENPFIEHPEDAITVSKEVYEAHKEKATDSAKLGGYGDYHYIYHVSSAEDAAKLEEIAAKYNLVLRDGEVAQYSGDKDDTQLNQQLSTAVGKGSIYREAPEFDHFSYFDSGSFQSAADIPLQDGRKAATYICNTAYNEMVSGDEVGGFTVSGDEPLITRSYTAADGTELTISQNSTKAIIYAFLDESYITVQVEIDNWRVAPTDGLSGVAETNFDLSEDVVNYVADFINYSNIGK
jgi:hypothetical protein